MVAIDAMTGDEVWRTYMTPDTGWEGTYGNTTPEGETMNRDLAGEMAAAQRYPQAYAANSIAAHHTPAIDPASSTLYIGTGGPGSPFDLGRPGDNLYAFSLLAMDTDTGDVKWYFQTMPHAPGNDDQDLISQALLFPLAGGGWGVGDGSKNGLYYGVNAANGDYLFTGDPLVPHSGNYLALPTADGVLKSPGQSGGVSISPASYDPTSGYVYIASIDRPNTYTLHTMAQPNGLPDLHWQTAAAVPLSQADGTLTALDLNNGGKQVWQVRTPQPLVGGALATGGGVVFMGEPNGHFRAYDSATGDELWSFQTGAYVGASAISYEVDGRQYVVVATGAASPAAGSAIGPDANRPGGAVFAFALPQQ
jgi:glucose dehydrogenase